MGGEANRGVERLSGGMRSGLWSGGAERQTYAAQLGLCGLSQPVQPIRPS